MWMLWVGMGLVLCISLIVLKIRKNNRESTRLARTQLLKEIEKGLPALKEQEGEILKMEKEIATQKPERLTATLKDTVKNFRVELSLLEQISAAVKTHDALA